MNAQYNNTDSYNIRYMVREVGRSVEGATGTKGCAGVSIYHRKMFSIKDS